MKILRNIFNELGIAFLGLLGGTISSKIGASLIFFILGFVFIFCSIVGVSIKPIAFYVIGGLNLVIGICLIFLRIVELKKNIDNEN